MHRFLVSAGRAGSTFIAETLNLRQDVFCLVESHHLPLLIDAFGAERASPRAHLAVLMTARFHTGQPVLEWNLDRLGLPSQVWVDWTQDLVRSSASMTVAEFQRAFEDFWLAQSSKSIFIDKTPCYGLALPEFRAALGKIQVVHLVRDVLPSIMSMVQHPGFRIKVRAGVDSWTDILLHGNLKALDGDTPITSSEMVNMAHLWATRTGQPIRDATSLGLDLTVLRYEDLIEAPEQTLGRLAGAFGLENTGIWTELVSKRITPSRTPESADDRPDLSALRDLPDVSAVRAMCGYATS